MITVIIPLIIFLLVIIYQTPPRSGTCDLCSTEHQFHLRILDDDEAAAERKLVIIYQARVVDV